MNLERHRRVIISGGGTGGHIFPAISIANALRSADPGIEILFVGALGRMEMELVPASGYRIVGLPVAGLKRKRIWENIGVLLKLMKSISQARRIIREFDPDAVVGVGGYASGPVMWVAGRMKLPLLIQEQNSFAGLTNRLLAGRASRICVAYEGMERYFPKEKIILTGNPVRSHYRGLEKLRAEAFAYFGIEAGSRVILVLGGSQGAGAINRTVFVSAARVRSSGLIWIWQSGRHYYENVKEQAEREGLDNVKVFSFIDRMDLAYSAADIIVSRSGAGTISELSLVGKPVILIPSPNVAEDHQTRNAVALVKRGAALMVSDDEAALVLPDEVMKLSGNKAGMDSMAENIGKMALPGAAAEIAEEVLKLAER
jgi:UDP-N-acetylglucosamine--N-acetylmuramyl-(pentapeptide) pyrophosphoryl-undecaprenol N-acetylglucosamine transferase